MSERMWIWDRPGWPQWDYVLRSATRDALRHIRDRRAQLADESTATPALVARAVKGALLREGSSTSEIEGEYISYDDLRDAATGLDPAEDADPRAAGVIGMLEACRAAPALDRAALLDMHERLLGYQRGRQSRGGPLQIGAYRRTDVHIRSRTRGIVYEAPGPDQVERLMANYLDWLGRPLTLPMNATHEPLQEQALLAPVKAAIAHLWFERIHPFADGNGRIGRAIAERVLRGRGIGAGYLATVIDVRVEQYYEELGKDGKDSQGNEVTPWVEWFVDVCGLSLEWEWERMQFERDRAAFFGQGGHRSLRGSAGSTERHPGGLARGPISRRCVNDAEWAALLGGAAPGGENLQALCDRGILSAADAPGQYHALAHFKDVGDRLFEVGVHWIPSACEPPPSEPSGQ